MNFIVSGFAENCEIVCRSFRVCYFVLIGKSAFVVRFSLFIASNMVFVLVNIR